MAQWVRPALEAASRPPRFDCLSGTSNERPALEIPVDQLLLWYRFALLLPQRDALALSGMPNVSERLLSVQLMHLQVHVEVLGEVCLPLFRGHVQQLGTVSSQLGCSVWVVVLVSQLL